MGGRITEIVRELTKKDTQAVMAGLQLGINDRIEKANLHASKVDMGFLAALALSKKGARQEGLNEVIVKAINLSPVERDFLESYKEGKK